MPIPDNIRARLEQLRMEAALRAEMERRQQQAQANAEKMSKQFVPGKAKGGPTSDDLKRFLAESKVKSRMYHGTSADISRFKPKSGDPVFLSPDPSFASKFALDDMLYGASSSATGPVKSGANVMPVYAQAKNPFDYENPKHIRSVLSRLDPRDRKAFKEGAAKGLWQEIEKHLGSIQDSGFDAVYLNEMGRKNLAVFDPSKIKSATGNRGTYDTSDPDITKAGGGRVLPKDQHDENLKRFLAESAIRQRMYTGTSKDKDFSKFNVPRNGAWFTPSTEVASSYAKENDSKDLKYDFDTRRYKEINTADRVMPVYLRTTKPYQITADDIKRMNVGNYKKAQSQFFDSLRALGHDSAVFEDGTTVILEGPHQIKSAIGNRGTYDPTDPDITKAEGGSVPSMAVMRLAVGGQGPKNWLKGSVEPVIDPLLSKGVINNVNIPYGPKFDEARAKRIADLKNTASQPGYTGGAAKVAQHLEEDAKNPRQHEAALNQWVTSNLANYIRKQMATHDDPIRKLAEQGIVHMPPEQMGYGTSQAEMVRKKLKAPRLGQSPEAQAWEDATDVSMYHTAAGDYMNTPREPWMEKADPETKVFRPTDNMHAHYLGFDHLVDILKQDLNEGRIRPEQLSKVSIEQAVRRAHEYDQERKKAMAETALKSTEGMPVHKDYGDGFKWIELAMPDKPLPEGYTPGGGNDKYVFDPSGNDVVHPNYQALQDALKYEGDTMGHCVGGYTNKVASGESRIFSLRDKNNEPHVTIEVAPSRKNVSPLDFYQSKDVPKSLLDKITEGEKTGMFDDIGAFDDFVKTSPEYQEYLQSGPPKINQIYGKSNQKPKKDYIPYVQDFVKGGDWADVKTLHNAEMRDMKKHSGLSDWLASKGIQHPRYLTEDEYGTHEGNMLLDKLGVQDKAKGGEVKQPSLDTMQLALTKFLKPSKVKSRVYHGTESKDDYDDDDSGNDAIKSFSGRATWVAEEPYTAHGYSGKSGYVMPLHIRLTNPLKIDHIDANDEAHHVYSIAKSLGVDVDHLKSIADPERVWEVINHPYFIDAASKAGFDGISINEGGRKTHAVFDPGNIKSATGNRGTYDPNSPDITKAEGGRVKQPKKTVKAYKLFRVDPKKPGDLFPLFVDANTPVKMGKWVDAKSGEMKDGKVKSKIGSLAYRPGWHAGDLPIATHIGEKSDPSLTAPDTRPDNHVWAEVEMPNDVDWQSEANKRGTNAQGKLVPVKAHITDQIPKGGHYRYKTNPNMTGNWLIGGSMKVNRVLSDDEVERINSAAGLSDLPRAKPFDAKKYGFAGGGKVAGVVAPDEWKAEEYVNHMAEGGSPKTPSIAQMKLALNKQGMYSPLEKAAMAVPRPKGTPAEFMAEISKQPGFRKEEVEDRKISLPEGKMTKEEFLGHLKNHPAPLLDEKVYRDESEDEDGDSEGQTQYGDWQLPGGQNYREVLLKTPNQGLNDKERDRKMWLEANQRRGSLTIPEDNELMKLQIKEKRGSQDYQSSHWRDDPNVLAHMRLSDRYAGDTGKFNVTGTKDGKTRWLYSTGINGTPEQAQQAAKKWEDQGYTTNINQVGGGKKLLHIEEIQSDWHQQGRKEGYYTPEQRQELKDAMREWKSGREGALFNGPDQFAKEHPEYAWMNRAAPDAPFKKNWHELALKHALGIAAREGYDGIVITPGQQQADRYDLSKHVQNIYHSANADGTFHASVLSPEGRVIWEDFRAPPEKIEATLGKDIAHKIVNGVGEEDNGMRRLDPEDMKVGGEGMKGFYDKIVPAYLNKLGKPHGAQVGKVTISAPNEKSWGIEDAAKFHGMTGSEYLDHPDRPQLEKQFLQARQNQTADLHYFPITESMRQQIKTEGLPQYERGGDVHPLIPDFEE